MPKTVLLTGGCGFIGSAVVRHLLRQTDHDVVNIDKLTYAASEEALEEARGHHRHMLVQADIADAAAMRAAFATHQPDAVMHLAAESHVDRSIDGPADVHPDQHRRHLRAAGGGAGLLRHAERRDGAQRSASTTSPPTRCSARWRTTIRRSPRRRPMTRAAPIPPARRPRTIWCAPGATLTACRRIVSNTTNNYGPWQFPEKLIPLITLNALEGRPLPVYGDGSQPARLAVRGGPCRGAAARAGARARRAPPIASARASRAATSMWCARSAPCSTPAARPGRPARAADHLRHRPARP